jgi:hypothetical protein
VGDENDTGVLDGVTVLTEEMTVVKGRPLGPVPVDVTTTVDSEPTTDGEATADEDGMKVLVPTTTEVNGVPSREIPEVVKVKTLTDVVDGGGTLPREPEGVKVPTTTEVNGVPSGEVPVVVNEKTLRDVAEEGGTPPRGVGGIDVGGIPLLCVPTELGGDCPGGEGAEGVT